MSDKAKANDTTGGAEPAKKKAKHAMQTNLFSYFAAPKTKEEDGGKLKEGAFATSTKQSSSTSTDSAEPRVPPAKNETKEGSNETKNIGLPTSDDDYSVPAPMVPKHVSPPRNVVWQSLHDDHILIRTPTKEKPRSKVAAFDMDGTLLVWSASFSGFWPNQLTHYELWSSTVPAKLRALYDGGYKILLISNQGGIQKAHKGKKATLVKAVMDWLAHLVDRPVHAVMSTKSLKKAPEASFHKPTPRMWQVAIDALNKRQDMDVAQSFFVGDSADPNDSQGGVDLRFAQAVGKKHAAGDGSTVLKFYTPTDYFGPSDTERRQKKKIFQQNAEAPPPKEALEARSALLGGYMDLQKGGRPVLLILCGVQGSGKSTFCQQLLGEQERNKDDGHWVHLSQDTINKGKPGKREKVEEEARAALERGHSVVVDRMHLDPEQRGYFVQVAKSAQVPAHVVLLNPPREVIAKRVRERTDHPGKVQGDDGARRALQSLDKLVLPTYSEDVQLINCASTTTGVSRLAALYKAVAMEYSIPEPSTEVPLSDTLSIPSIALGTMGIGKKDTKDAVLTAISAGIRAIDTAPTYKNEDRVGDALAEIDSEVFCIGKIPKAATQPEDVRSELEATLEKLKRPFVHLLLLHWPCDVIASGTLAAVWKEMEECCKEGKCKALGVCNFNANSLATLLSNCSMPPVVNQVERHPLMAQMDLVDFCARNNILIQAHTPLGQGKNELLANETIIRIAKESSMSPAQVALRWNLQQGVLVTPKCRSEDHAKELAVSSKSLTPEHMKLLDSLDKNKRFVTPPFMYGSTSFCWGDRMPRK